VQRWGVGELVQKKRSVLGGAPTFFLIRGNNKEKNEERRKK
jgi:hypothetical protein